MDRFEIGVVGNFSGRDGAEGAEVRLAEKACYVVDLDELDALVRRIAPRLELGLEFAPVVAIEEWNEFHPDGLAARLPSLASLLRARHAVGDVEQLREHLEAAGCSLDTPAAEGASAGGEPAAAAPAGEAASGSDLLDSMLSEAERASPPPGAAGDDFDRAIREIIDASVDRTDYAAQERWREKIDAELSRRTRQILHHPSFSRTEGSWRALRVLAEEALAADAVRVRLLDLGPEDALLDLRQAEGRAGRTMLHRLLVEAEKGTPGGDAFDLLLFDAILEEDEQGRSLAALLAGLAEAAECPVLAGVGTSISGISRAGVERRTGAVWPDLAALAGARRVGLAAPRVLARLPYGESGEPTEHFTFDELAETGSVEQLPWASSAYLVAQSVVLAVDAGLGVEGAARFARIGEKPMHVVHGAGEFEQVGPSERLLTETEIIEIRERGLIPVAGIKGTDEVEVMSFRGLTGAALFGKR